ncbi:aldo/keto reductase [Campylobacter sp. RM13119]|uniref:aldo/keto reductase n=1 Tax=Campylobacter californiensis TaxID=1032243 RepID=UPI001472FC60|nr:aldo/keto reductase [Campylobacter sp. RM13119]MBE3606663.1 aldo/keto reductase [Campylobacter sp. RM13119]
MQYKILNDGNKMPMLGFGVFQIEPNLTQKCVEDAISVGYRSIDTAQAYFNEEQTGAALRTAIEGGVKREELFVTTKIWINNMDSETKALKSIETSLKKLGLDYLDMLLIHQPYNDIYGTWRVMKRLKDEGVLKSIGVSNFYADKVADLCENTGVVPAINQLECHPFYQREALKKVLDSYGVAFWSWASFAEGKNDIFKNQILQSIGDKYGKSVAQVVLRWLIQRDILVIPKSVNVERMRENFDVFDFTLSDDDMKLISTLDTGKTLFFDHTDSERAKWIINVWKDKFK